MPTLFLLRIVALLVYLLSVPVWSQTVTIGLVNDGPAARTLMPRQLLMTEIKELLGKDYDIQFHDVTPQNKAWIIDDIHSTIDSLLKNSEVDVILALGPLSAHILGNYDNLSKPVIALFVIDPALQGIPVFKGASGVRNLTYISDNQDAASVINDFYQIVPFQHVAIVIEAIIFEGIPELKDVLNNYENINNIKFSFVATESTVSKTLQKIYQGPYDAVILTPLRQMTMINMRQVADGLKEHNLPSFALGGIEVIRQGFLAGYDAEVNQKPMARRVALNLQRILDGQKVATIPVTFNSRSKIILNQSVARQLNRFPNWDSINKYEVINRDTYKEQVHLSFKNALLKASQRSLTIASVVHQTRAVKSNINSSKANLLPSLGLQADYKRFNRGSASISNPQKQTSASLVFSQVIWSEDAYRAHQAQKYAYLSQEKVLEQVRLDVVLNAAVIYLNLLKARKVEELQFDNLERAKKNLELAKIRKRIGSAAAGEVYRWQSQIATNQGEYVTARSRANQLTVNLLHLLNWPQHQRLALQPVTLADAGFFFKDKRFDLYIKNPWSFRKFHDFMVKEAFLGSPELQQIRERVNAQAQIHKSFLRKHWMPTIRFNASYNEVFDSDGAGANKGFEHDTWQTGISASLPIYSGGRNTADETKAYEKLSSLQVQKQFIQTQVEQRVRLQLLASEGSYPKMQYSQLAAEAANKNLELVTDSYQRGAVSILDLIDSQNSTLAAEITSVNAIYDFMIDYFTLERELGVFNIFSSEKDKNAWYERMNAYFGSPGK